MTLTFLGWIYFFCFVLGLGYTLISLLLTHGGADGGDGGADADTDIFGGHGHGHGHGHAVGGEPAQPDFPLFSPLTIALGLTTFGGVGTIMNLMNAPGYATLPVASLAGLAGWGGAFYFFFKLFRITQGSSEALVEQLPGKEGIITVSVPADGMGEVSYVARGSRYNAPAQSQSNVPLLMGSQVVIVRILDGICIVKESVDEKLKQLNEGENQ